MNVQILPLSDDVKSLYSNHGTYHPGDSGLDLFITQQQLIKTGETAWLKLGIKTAAYNGKCPTSWLMLPRSSIAKTPLRLCNSLGLIDAGYRGEVMVAVDNIKGEDYQVKVGDRIVQAVAFTGGEVTFQMVDKLDDTARGEGGFGSTTGGGGEKGIDCNGVGGEAEESTKDGGGKECHKKLKCCL